MIEPDIAFANIDYICYSTPHSAAYEMLDDETKEDPMIYPDNDFLAEKGYVYSNLSKDGSKKMQDLWTEMKSAESETANRFLVPAFLILCIVIVIGVLIRRHIKEKDIF